MRERAEERHIASGLAGVLPAGGVEVEVAEGLVRIAVVPAEQIVVQEALRMKSQEMARELERVWVSRHRGQLRHHG